MSAKHGRRGVNCDLPEHKSHQSALVLSAIDTSSTRFQDLTKTENVLQAVADKKRNLDKQIADLRIRTTSEQVDS